MREIPLTRGAVTLVDDEDYMWLTQWKWTFQKKHHTYTGIENGYAARSESGTIFMHRALLQAPKGIEVDHIDGNGLNNTRANLRLCTRQENSRNQRPRKDGSSLYKGVSWYAPTEKWRVSINPKGDKPMHLGYFTDEIEAARAYDSAAKQLFGVFAYLNFPDEVQY